MTTLHEHRQPRWFERARAVDAQAGCTSPSGRSPPWTAQPVAIVSRAGRASVRRGRQRATSTSRLLGARDPRARAPRVVRAVAQARRAGLLSALADRAGGRARRAPRRPRARMRDGALCRAPGTEATMSAIRWRARRPGARIVKFAGCYHGHADALLVKAGSGAATLGVPDSPGVPRRPRRHGGGASSTTSTAWIAGHAEHKMAAVIVEPVAGNMGCVPPSPRLPEGLAIAAPGRARFRSSTR